MKRIARGLAVVAVFAVAFAGRPSQARADVGITVDGSTTGVHPILPMGNGMGLVLDGSATGVHPVVNFTHPAFLDSDPGPVADPGTTSSSDSSAVWVAVALTVVGAIAFGVIASQLQSSYNQQVAQQQAAFNARVQQQQAGFPSAASGSF